MSGHHGQMNTNHSALQSFNLSSHSCKERLDRPQGGCCKPSWTHQQLVIAVSMHVVNSRSNINKSSFRLSKWERSTSLDANSCNLMDAALSLLAAVKTAYAGQLGFCSQPQTAHFPAAKLMARLSMPATKVRMLQLHWQMGPCSADAISFKLSRCLPGRTRSMGWLRMESCITQKMHCLCQMQHKLQNPFC